MQKDNLITVAEFAKKCGVASITVYKWIEAEKISFTVKYGRKLIK
jgi:excisionase family DNA binding protein